jgi:hypothetical protein
MNMAANKYRKKDAVVNKSRRANGANEETDCIFGRFLD